MTTNQRKTPLPRKSRRRNCNRRDKGRAAFGGQALGPSDAIAFIPLNLDGFLAALRRLQEALDAKARRVNLRLL